MYYIQIIESSDKTYCRKTRYKNKINNIIINGDYNLRLNRLPTRISPIDTRSKRLSPGPNCFAFVVVSCLLCALLYSRRK